MFETAEVLQWIAGLKAGDDVAVESRNQSLILCKVNGRTPRSRVKVSWLGTELVFDKDGNERGRDPWNPKRLIVPTPEVQERIRAVAERKTMMSIINEVKWNSVALEKLREVARIVGP